jgi:hypothetical protein
VLQFLNEVPVYLFDCEQAAFTGLSASGNVDCRVTKAAILMRARLEDAGPSELIAALMRERGYFEEIARDTHARSGGVFILIDTGDLRVPDSAAA